MNSHPEHCDPVAEEQASLWAARLDGSELSAADRTALDEWLASNPEHRVLLTHFCQFSADLEQQLPLIEGSKEMSEEILAPKTAQSLPWSRWPLMAGAMLTAAAAVALAFWLGGPRSQFETVATPVARRQALTLADGSRVELNAQTNLQIEIDGKGRHVRLASGEAFFSVQKDATRPFLVETPTGSVRVTGTKFDVLTETAGSLEVTVLEGSVLAHPALAGGSTQPPVSLAAGQKLSSHSGSVAVQMLSASSLDDALAWRQGRIVFKDVPLREALARFARYHGRGITATADAAELSVGARFNLDDLEGFFATLEEVLPVKVTRNLDGTVLVGRRGEP